MGLFKNILKPKSKAEKGDPEESKFMPEHTPPTDEFFVANFKKNGGKFLYCENQNEVLNVFKEIQKENNWEKTSPCCFDDNLKDLFGKQGLNFTKEGDAPFFLSGCEYLIANTGSLLFSSNQIKELKLTNLPDTFVILAGTSQLVDTVGEGLRMIKNKQKKIPTNITAIKTFEDRQESDFLSYGSTSKNLYLLLLEDL